MELIYLRHGLTPWNVERRLQGQSDVPLNEAGISDAKRVGKILQKYTFDAIYCSPLLRTRQTLEYALPGAIPILDDRLTEWCFGPFEGGQFPEDFFRNWWVLGRERVDGMEIIEDVIARAKDFYSEVKEKHPDGRILVVSHGGFSGALYGAIYGIENGENLSKHCLPNTTPVLFREGEEPIVLQENNSEE